MEIIREKRNGNQDYEISKRSPNEILSYKKYWKSWEPDRKKIRKRRNNNNDEISIKKDLTCDMVLLEQHVSHKATNTHYFSTFLNAIL